MVLRDFPGLLVLAVDLSHVGPRFGDTPLTRTLAEEARRRDLGFLERLAEGEPEAALAFLGANPTRIDGVEVVASLLPSSGKGRGRSWPTAWTRGPHPKRRGGGHPGPLKSPRFGTTRRPGRRTARAPFLGAPLWERARKVGGQARRGLRESLLARGVQAFTHDKGVA